MGDKNKMRTAMSIVLAFFLFVALSLATIVSGAGLTVFSSDHFTKSFKDSIYAEKNYDSITSALQEEAELHSLPENLLSGQLEYAGFRETLETNIRDASEGREISNQPAEDFALQVESAIDDYLKKNGVGSSSYIESAVDEITAKAQSLYSDYTTLPFAAYFAEISSSAAGVIRILVPVCAVLALIALVVLIKLQENSSGRKFYISSSVCGAGIVNLAVGYILSRMLDFTFAKELAGYDSFIDGFFHGASSVFWICGILLITAALVIKFERNK
ncbi:MAG: hypothetical protein ACI4LD_05875 [Lentihominibacter sp.]